MVLNPHVLSPETIDWLAQRALDELRGYLSDGDPYEDHGQEWPEIARNHAAKCRAVALAVQEPGNAEWLQLADRYEATIRSEDGGLHRGES